MVLNGVVSIRTYLCEHLLGLIFRLLVDLPYFAGDLAARDGLQPPPPCSRELFRLQEGSRFPVILVPAWDEASVIVPMLMVRRNVRVHPASALAPAMPARARARRHLRRRLL